MRVANRNGGAGWVVLPGWVVGRLGGCDSMVAAYILS